MALRAYVRLLSYLLWCYGDDISQSFKFEALVMLLVLMATLLGEDLADSVTGLEMEFGVRLIGLALILRIRPDLIP